VEYRDEMPGAGVELIAKLLFKDSTNVAGDLLVRNLIERLLLPKLGARFRHDELACDGFEAFFRQSFSNQSQKEEWKRITRLLLVPLVVRWLGNLCAGKRPAETPLSEVLDLGTVREFNQRFSEHYLVNRLGN